MEKMIKVINDNLRNVISGIKEHRLDLEETLDSIKSDMSLKVKEANAYKVMLRLPEQLYLLLKVRLQI